MNFAKVCFCLSIIFLVRKEIAKIGQFDTIYQVSTQRISNIMDFSSVATIIL